jgi:hypothetical protein
MLICCDTVKASIGIYPHPQYGLPLCHPDTGPLFLMRDQQKLSIKRAASGAPP